MKSPTLKVGWQILQDYQDSANPYTWDFKVKLYQQSKIDITTDIVLDKVYKDQILTNLETFDAGVFGEF